jgi:hypothetical protein
MASDHRAALRRATEAENAAIYAYGVLGSRLAGADRTRAIKADGAHRDLRDALGELLAAIGGTATPPAAAYRLPAAPTDAAAALTLAALIETRVAAVWRQTLADLTGLPDTAAARALALDALGATAVRATQWRGSANPSATPIVPFPGM